MSERDEAIVTFHNGLLKAKETCDNLLKRRFVVAPGFEIHGGCAGLYDFGPTGAAINTKLEALWRDHFVVYDEMLEVQTTCLTPYNVFKASGHVDKFIDLMVQDSVTGDNYRADRLLADFIDRKITASHDKKCKPKDKLTEEEIQKFNKILSLADSYNQTQMEQVLTDLKVITPLGNSVTAPTQFNLMFQSNIGPRVCTNNTSSAFLRPETAQGIFVNFKRLYEQNNKRLPMGAAQIGLGFRNEIAPRNGLLRVREFKMAEIEYFVDPTQKTFKGFESVSHLKLPLLSAEIQESGSTIPIRDITLKEALQQGILKNETLAYFLGRTYLFLTKLGINGVGIRFRQHMSDEMAHYASDCWDGEVLSAHGWIECCGHADRSAFDLKCHMDATNISLEASRAIPPTKQKFAKREINKKLMGPTFKKSAGDVIKLLNEISYEDAMKLEAELEANGSYELTDGSASNNKFIIQRNMVKMVESERIVQEEFFLPHVIEPSFGLGRIFSVMMEHTFKSRDITDQSDRNFLALPAIIAPYHCSLLPLSNNSDFDQCIADMRRLLRTNYISCIVDGSGASIGKRYARTDEIGIPFAITIDFDTLKDQTVTVRERDSMTQVRVPISDIIDIIQSLNLGVKVWTDMIDKYGLTQTGA